MVKVRKNERPAKSLSDDELRLRISEIGRAIKRERSARSSIDRFSYEAQISRSNISKYEAGGDMLLSTFLKILHGLDIPADKFFKKIQSK